MTQVYNYFAIPPARNSLCDVAMQVANEFTTTQPEDPKAFAAIYLPRFEAGYEAFFRAYEQYRVDSAAWDSKWGAQYGASQPGYVAVHGGSGTTIATTPGRDQYADARRRSRRPGHRRADSADRGSRSDRLHARGPAGGRPRAEVIRGCEKERIFMLPSARPFR